MCLFFLPIMGFLRVEYKVSHKGRFFFFLADNGNKQFGLLNHNKTRFTINLCPETTLQIVLSLCRMKSNAHYIHKSNPSVVWKLPFGVSHSDLLKCLTAAGFHTLTYHCCSWMSLYHCQENRCVAFVMLIVPRTCPSGLQRQLTPLLPSLM